MPQLEVLRKFLSGFVSIPPLEWLQLVKLLGLRRLENDSFYFRQGEAVDELAFVVKGLLYNFYTNSQGEDYVKYFVKEGEVVSCYSSVLQGIPANFSSLTLEPTTLVTLKYKDLKSLFQRHSCWQEMARVYTEKLYIEKEEREQHFLMANARTRYQDFVKAKPQLLQRVPQYLIASYIGISPVSLSRIRSQKEM